ncbi:excisionase family DNA-binding protein [Kribbella sp. NPDC023972]|uniref:excisionase family DNA-binding protein n=1 Tax=Kribbella sp. NPDC023972 TaxID=3154795 RepID=UPI0033D0FCD9
MRLSDVEHHRDRADPMTLKEAARLLRCSKDDIRKLIADGNLTAVHRSRRPVYRLEVQKLATELGVLGRKRGRDRTRCLLATPAPAARRRYS